MIIRLSFAIATALWTTVALAAPPSSSPSGPSDVVLQYYRNQAEAVQKGITNLQSQLDGARAVEAQLQEQIHRLETTHQPPK